METKNTCGFTSNPKNTELDQLLLGVTEECSVISLEPKYFWLRSKTVDH
jgi:hypothetical protein